VTLGAAWLWAIAASTAIWIALALIFVKVVLPLV
jgi:hypothetical protein